LADKGHSATVEVDDVQEVISLISKLDGNQKQIVLASLRGAVLIADSEKRGRRYDTSGN
jgi:hypothetical protein